MASPHQKGRISVQSLPAHSSVFILLHYSHQVSQPRWPPLPLSGFTFSWSDLSPSFTSKELTRTTLCPKTDRFVQCKYTAGFPCKARALCSYLFVVKHIDTKPWALWVLNKCESILRKLAFLLFSTHSSKLEIALCLAVTGKWTLLYREVTAKVKGR